VVDSNSVCTDGGVMVICAGDGGKLTRTGGGGKVTYTGSEEIPAGRKVTYTGGEEIPAGGKVTYRISGNIGEQKIWHIGSRKCWRHFNLADGYLPMH